MDKILFLTDFSENAKCAIYYGLSLYKSSSCKFVMVHKTFLPYNKPNSEASPEDVRTENARDCFAQLLKDIRTDFPDQQFDIETHIITGDLEKIAKKAIKEKEIDLIVMGAHGTTGIADVLMGSNTLTILEQIDKPVIIVPQNYKFQDLSNVVLAMDNGAGPPETVLRPMVELAEKNSSQVLVLHVSKNAEVEKDLEHKNVKKSLQKVRSHYLTIYDQDVANGLGKFIKEQQVDMLSMIKQKLNFFERVFHKSLSNKMVLQADIPLLIMSHKKS